MTRSHNFGLISTGFALAACSSASAHSRPLAASSGCDQLKDSQAVIDTFYAPGAVHSARKVERTEIIARAIQAKRTMGADLYVHAPRDLSQGYLERVLTCHATSGKPAHPNDPLYPTEGSIADISVRAAGDSLAVRVLGEDPRTGREIFQRGEALKGSPGTVEVEQVAVGQNGPSSTL